MSETKTRPAFKFEIPADAAPRSCMSCGARVYWIITKAGKRMPVDPDGTSHFATCPNHAQHRKPRERRPR